MLLVSTLIGCILAGALGFNSYEWTGYLGNLQITGYSLCSGPTRGYALTWKATDGSKRFIKVQVFQYAFLSIARLSHVIGHEGIHVVDFSSGKPLRQREWEQKAMNWNRAHSGIPLFPWTFFPPFTVEPE